MHKAQSDSLGQGNEGNMTNNNGVASATANYRAAGIVAAAARAERDYHLATLHLQTKLAEAAERRALTNLSASMQGPMKDDYEVAQACLNLRTDGKDGMYPMVDPNYPRIPDVQRRNGSEVPPTMPGGPMMQNPQFNGHPRFMNPHAPPMSIMDPHMHPLQNPQLESMPRDMHPHGPMAGGMHYMAEYHGGLNGKRKYDPSITAEGEYTKKMKSAFQGSNSSSATIKNHDTKKGKRPADMPRRPLSAYNFFFSEERERVLAALPSPDDPKKKKDSEDKSKDVKDEGKSNDVKDEGKTADTTPAQENSDSTPKETDGTSKEIDVSPKDKDETAKDTDVTSTVKDETPKGNDDTPAVVESTSKDNTGTPKGSNTTPEGKNITPEGSATTSKANDVTPESVGATTEGSEIAATVSPSSGVTKNAQSNQDRLLSLRLVQHNIRRPHRKTHGKIGFKALAKLIGERWRALNAEQKVPYRKLAETDLARYKEQMEEYNRKNKWAFLQDSESQPPPGN